MSDTELQEPKNLTEAEVVRDHYQTATWDAPDPGPTQILSYAVRDILDPDYFLLTSPFEGPPLPSGAGVRWSEEELHAIKIALGVSNPEPPPWAVLGAGAAVVIAGVVAFVGLGQGFKQAKPHKQMKLDNLPKVIPDIDVYVLKKKVEGDFQSSLSNLSDEVEIPGGGEIKTTMDGTEDKFKGTLISGFSQANEKIPVKEAATYLLKQAILYQGAWETIKALWDILVNKKLKIHLEVPTKIGGYETDKFIVDDYAKSFSIDAEVKVDNIHWHAL